MDETLNNIIDPPIYVFSGGKGLPANNLIRSVLVQFPENKIPVKIIPDITDMESLEEGIRKVSSGGGIIVHTLLDKKLKTLLVSRCKEIGIRVFGLDISTNRLVSHRKKRLSDFGFADSNGYKEPRAIRSELDYAYSIFRRGGYRNRSNQ
jgi:regulator of PEP synthase PpsR (kinase-PPPase family)